MTNYEFEDYRNNEPPRMGSWPFWIVPEFYALSYLIRMAIILVALPMLFGIQLTPVGLFFMFLIFDYFTYVGLKKVYGLK